MGIGVAEWTAEEKKLHESQATESSQFNDKNRFSSLPKELLAVFLCSVDSFHVDSLA